jgi:hypothetical protein
VEEKLFMIKIREGCLIRSFVSQIEVIFVQISRWKEAAGQNFLELAQLNVCSILLTFPENQWFNTDI